MKDCGNSQNLLKHKQPIYKLHRVVASSDTFRVAFVLNDATVNLSIGMETETCTANEKQGHDK